MDDLARLDVVEGSPGFPLHISDGLRVGRFILTDHVPAIDGYHAAYPDDAVYFAARRKTVFHEGQFFVRLRCRKAPFDDDVRQVSRLSLRITSASLRLRETCLASHVRDSCTLGFA